MDPGQYREEIESNTFQRKNGQALMLTARKRRVKGEAGMSSLGEKEKGAPGVQRVKLRKHLI